MATNAAGDLIYCLCRQVERGWMIMCDDCKEWFHGDCVGLTKASGENLPTWSCPPCKRKKDSAEAKKAALEKERSKRETVSSKITSALLLNKNSTNTDARIEQVARSVEEALYVSFRRSTSGAYLAKFRALFLNLKHPKNGSLREALLSGDLSPEDFCSKDASELAPKELQDLRKKVVEELNRQRVIDSSDAKVLVRKTRNGIEIVGNAPMVTIEPKPLHSSSKRDSPSNGDSSAVERDMKRAKVASPSRDADGKIGSLVDDSLSSPLSLHRASSGGSPPSSSPSSALGMIKNVSTTGASIDGAHSKPSSSPVMSTHDHVVGGDGDGVGRGGGGGGAVGGDGGGDVGGVDIVASPPPSKPQPPPRPLYDPEFDIQLNSAHSIAQPFNPDDLLGEMYTPMMSQQSLWMGDVKGPNDQICSVNAYHVKGVLDQPLGRWLPTALKLEHRVDLKRLGKFVAQLEGSTSRNCTIVSFEATTARSQMNYEGLFRYYHERRRAGVVAKRMLSGDVLEVFVAPLATTSTWLKGVYGDAASGDKLVGVLVSKK